MIDWTGEADALLIKLWGDGCSLARIADELRKAGYPVSRNAVSGRRHRLPRLTFKKREAQPRPPKPLRVKPVSDRKPTSAEIAALSNVIGVDYFANAGCKATLDKRGDWGLPLVCGEPVGERGVYCVTHFRLYHYPQTARRPTDGQASEVPGNRNFRQARA